MINNLRYSSLAIGFFIGYFRCTKGNHSAISDSIKAGSPVECETVRVVSPCATEIIERARFIKPNFRV